MSRKQDNLAELWHRFQSNTCAALAIQEMNVAGSGETSFDLDVLLRHHDDGEEGIWEEDEVAMRDAFDDLLAFYGCVEIAAIIDFVPTRLPQDFRLTATRILCNRDVRLYYRQNYPLLLPDLLLARIANLRSKKEGLPNQAIPLFYEFLHISSILEEDSSVEMLLWFLDDGVHSGYDLESVLEILSRPNKVMKALNNAHSKSNPAEKAVDGLRKFLAFCVALDDLLARSKAYPLFRSAVWHYHSYWFRILRGEVRDAVEAAIKSVQSWTSPTAKGLSKKNARSLHAEAEASLSQIRNAVRRLTGNKYAAGLGSNERAIRRDSARAVSLLKRKGKEDLKRTKTRRLTRRRHQ
jgi:hypothetical protein